ncbi:MAG: hypothetical protein WC375_06365 [Methanomassiliicoccales archaeon]|jgi:hypothetical protein
MKLINVVISIFLLIFIMGSGLAAKSGPIEMRNGANITLDGGKVLGSPNGTAATDLMTVRQGWDKLNNSGGTMTGPIAMGSNKITGLTNGSAAQDAVAYSQLQKRVYTNGVTVGHSAPAQYIADGSADQATIETALAASHTVYILNDGGRYYLDDDIDIPTGDYHIIGVPSDSGYKPIIEQTANAPCISSQWQGLSSFDISDVNIDMGDIAPYGILVLNGISGPSSVHDCCIYNSSVVASHGIYYVSQYGASQLEEGHPFRVYGNEMYDMDVNGIKAITYGTPGLTVIENNYLHDFAPTTQLAYAAIDASNATISHNIIINITGPDRTTYSTMGICGDYSIIDGNTVIAADRGVVPGLGCIVSGNKISWISSSGINFWNSSSSIVYGNDIAACGMIAPGGWNNTYPLDAAESAYWDMPGIDIADHSNDTLVYGNYITSYGTLRNTKFTTLVDLDHITVNDSTGWCPNMLISLAGEAGHFRTTSVDHITNSIGLNRSQANYHGLGDVLVYPGPAVGICIGDNGMSGGGHRVFGNQYYYITYPVSDMDASPLPDTVAEGYLYTSAPTIDNFPIGASVTAYISGTYYQYIHIGGGTWKRATLS